MKADISSHFINITNIDLFLCVLYLSLSFIVESSGQFVKWQINILGFVGLPVSVATLKSHRQYINGWPWLHFNKT